MCSNDSRIGIEGQELPCIFERLYRARFCSPETGGTGIGLAVTAEIIRARGGGIGVVSEPGKGSTFTIELSRTIVIMGAERGGENE